MCFYAAMYSYYTAPQLMEHMMCLYLMMAIILCLPMPGYLRIMCWHPSLPSLVKRFALPLTSKHGLIEVCYGARNKPHFFPFRSVAVVNLVKLGFRGSQSRRCADTFSFIFSHKNRLRSATMRFEIGI